MKVTRDTWKFTKLSKNDYKYKHKVTTIGNPTAMSTPTWTDYGKLVLLPNNTYQGEDAINLTILSKIRKNKILKDDEKVQLADANKFTFFPQSQNKMIYIGDRGNDIGGLLGDSYIWRSTLTKVDKPRIHKK